jgi:hypothetical protein
MNCSSNDMIMTTPQTSLNASCVQDMIMMSAEQQQQERQSFTFTSSPLYPSLKGHSSIFERLEREQEEVDSWWELTMMPTSREKSLIDDDADEMEVNFMSVPQK